MTKHIVAAQADKSDLQPQPCSTAGKNGGRGTNRQPGRIDQLFHLTEFRGDFPGENQVGVKLASHKDIKHDPTVPLHMIVIQN